MNFIGLWLYLLPPFKPESRNTQLRRDSSFITFYYSVLSVSFVVNPCKPDPNQKPLRTTLKFLKQVV